MSVELLHGDCVKVLAGMADCSVDSVVTDPPYEISFMAKTWDGSGIAYNVDLWRECLRVLKPGGHLLAFGGTRTYHRMAVAIEDAGFEVRDSLHWLYGSGFPKSLDVSKAIDKAAGAEREVVGHAGSAQPQTVHRGALDYGGATGKAKNGLKDGHDITAPATDAARQWEGWGTALKPAHEPVVVARKPLVGTVAANVLEHGTGALNIDGCRVGMSDADRHVINSMGGFGSAGWVNTTSPAYNTNNPENPLVRTQAQAHAAGRWPANLVLTHAAECGEACAEGCPVAELDGQSGVSKSSGAGTKCSNRDKNGKCLGHRNAGRSTSGETFHGPEGNGIPDSGGASRFFTVTEWDPIADVAPFRYVAKPSKRERNAGLDGLPERPAPKMDGGPFVSPTGNDSTKVMARNVHPTVKPVALMRWLVRLVTPPGGTVLDPFAGSGTTLVAATLEGFDCIGIEMTDDYLPIIDGRVAWAEQQSVNQPVPPSEPTLFDGEADR